MLLADSRTARVLITVLLFALALGFLYVARATLIAFLFAIFFAYLMSPLVNHLEKLLRGAYRAIAVIYALLIALVVVFFVLVGPRVTHQGARLGQSLPDPAQPTQLRPDREPTGREHGWSRSTTELFRPFSSAMRTTSPSSRSASDCAPPTWPSRRGCCLLCHCSRSFF